MAVGVSDTLLLTEPVAVALWLPDTDGLTVRLLDVLPDGLPLSEVVGECVHVDVVVAEKDVDWLLDCVVLVLLLVLADELADPLRLALLVVVGVMELECVADHVALQLLLAVAVEVAEAVLVQEVLAVEVALRDVLTLGDDDVLADGEPLGETEAVVLGVALLDALLLAEGEKEALAEVVREAEGDVLAVRV